MAKRRIEIDHDTGRKIFRSPVSPDRFKLGLSHVWGCWAFWLDHPRGKFSMSLSDEDAKALARVILKETPK